MTMQLPEELLPPPISSSPSSDPHEQEHPSVSRTPSENVFLLWHTHESPEGDDDKLIGVYASAEDAEAAKLRVLSQPGFRDHPNGFIVACYRMGEDNWTEGFISWEEASRSIQEDDS